MSNEILSPLVGEIRDILHTARKNVAREVNNELILSYWKIGEIILSDVSKNPDSVWKIEMVSLLRITQHIE